MSERKEMSTEMRSLMAAVLCLVVIAGWSLIYKPPQPPPANPAAVTTNPAPPPAQGAPPTSVPVAEKTRGSCRSCDHARRERGKFRRDRKRSVSRGNFQSRRRGAKLAAQEIHRRSQTAAHARSGPSRCCAGSPEAGPFLLRWTIRSRKRLQTTRCLKSLRRAKRPTPAPFCMLPRKSRCPGATATSKSRSS